MTHHSTIASLWGEWVYTHYQLPVWVYPTATMVVCAIALFRGRNEERLAAASNLAAWALTVYVANVRHRMVPTEQTQWDIALIDAGLLGFYLWIVLHTRRRWPVVLAGAWLLAVLTHIVRPYPAISGWTYVTLQLVWAYLALLIIGYAAWTAPRYAESEGAPNPTPGATRR